MVLVPKLPFGNPLQRNSVSRPWPAWTVVRETEFRWSGFPNRVGEPESKQKRHPLPGGVMFLRAARQRLLEGDLLRRNDVLVVLLGDGADDGPLLGRGADLAVVGL